MDRLQKRRAAYYPAGILFALLWVGPNLLSHMKQSSDPDLYAADTRIYIFPLFRYTGSLQFQGDYIADYMTALSPIGFQGLYHLAAMVGIDPVSVSKLLPYFLLASTAAAMAAAAWAVGGEVAALLALLFVLGSDAYLVKMVGGLQRAFGFPLLAAVLVAFVRANSYALAALVVIGTLFYPMVAFLSGLLLTLLLTSSQKHRFALWASAVLFSAIPLAYMVMQTIPYGAAIGPSDIDAFPEAGPGGRYASDDQVGSALFFQWTLKCIQSLLPVHRMVALQLLLAMAAIGGFVALSRKKPQARSLLWALAAVPVGYLIARMGAPFFFLPERYISYLLPVLLHLYIACGAAYLIQQHLSRFLAPVALFIVVYFLCGSVDPTTGLNRSVKADRPALDAIAALPPNSVIAGWPGRIIDDVPYAARKLVLVSGEAHQAFHKGYVQEMRMRMEAFLDAYFADSLEPTVKLREGWGVTHLLVDTKDWQDSVPLYMEPFNRTIWEKKQAAKGKKIALQNCLQSAAIAHFGPSQFLLDLSKIGPGKVCD